MGYLREYFKLYISTKCPEYTVTLNEKLYSVKMVLIIKKIENHYLINFF